MPGIRAYPFVGLLCSSELEYVQPDHDFMSSWRGGTEDDKFELPSLSVFPSVVPSPGRYANLKLGRPSSEKEPKTTCVCDSPSDIEFSVSAYLGPTVAIQLI